MYVALQTCSSLIDDQTDQSVVRVGVLSSVLEVRRIPTLDGSDHRIIGSYELFTRSTRYSESEGMDMHDKLTTACCGQSAPYEQYEHTDCLTVTR